MLQGIDLGEKIFLFQAILSFVSSKFWESYTLPAIWVRVECIVLTPLPIYLCNRGCNDPTHITNSERESFAGDMGRGLRELTVNIRNMIFTRKLKDVNA